MSKRKKTPKDSDSLKKICTEEATLSINYKKKKEKKTSLAPHY